MYRHHATLDGTKRNRVNLVEGTMEQVAVLSKGADQQVCTEYWYSDLVHLGRKAAAGKCNGD